jgi:E3 ubiquitin-protein ligase SHPRH
MYKGISNGWVSPTELSTYNVVITDFTTLSKELYFASSADRSLRKDKKFEYPLSPLMCVRWWRVVLDEAQLVENKTNRPSQMVKQLPAINRWCTTGTPIEKDSIRCLYGLLYFLNLQPFTDEILFERLWQEYRQGQPDEMMKILSCVMWRTCKKNVEHEINISNQTEILHEVDMTDLQKYFYRQVHLTTIPQFMKNVHEFLLRNGNVEWVERMEGQKVVQVRERVVDNSMKNRFLFELNNATIKIFLEPLRRLRQDCTIPSIFQTTSNDQAKVKQTLKPTELHEHLVSKTSIESKSALRTVVSSINGIAALRISEEKYEEAIACYKQVLKLAGDYTDVVSVDSMLQIHAYHGLIEIATLSGNESEQKQTEIYLQEMSKLEWKYISNYYNKVREINQEMNEHRPELVKATKELTDTDGNWWRDIVTLRRSYEEESRLMETINLEVFSSIMNNSQIIEQLRSTRGIQLIITDWCDKIQTISKVVKRLFSNMDFIVKSLRPANEMTKKDNERVADLAKAALNCHLNLLDAEDDDSPRNPKKKGHCDLCKLKLKLNEYECVLFNKMLVADDMVEGTWNPRFEEKLLKAIYMYARRSEFGDDIITMGQKFFKYLEAMKTQFKGHAKLWVEVNYTISAFDELNMCKMRMQVVDEITEEDARYSLKIARYDFQDQLLQFEEQKQEAEINFVRLNGRLKYLMHLKERNEPPSCPICTNVPKERYFVTVCGHSICTECFHLLLKNRSRFVNCPVCRTHQETKDIYAVTCYDSSSSTEPINGSWSPKIDEIVRCVLRLKKEDPKVKILIFSHWDGMLQAIVSGLETNNIIYRASFTANFAKQIQEFQDSTCEESVTCMMLNLKFGGKGLNLVEGI